MKLMAITIFLFGLIMTPQGFNDKRILVIAASEKHTEVENQISTLQEKSKELKERKLAVFTLIDGELEAIFNSSEQSKKFVEAHKSDYKVASNPKIYLIGLDRSIKQSFDEFANPQQIFDIVDRMPMRRAEMRRN